MTRSSPTSALTSVDLPTFGRPTIATRGWPCSSSSLVLLPREIARARASISSRTPSPCAAEIAAGAPRPSSWNSATAVSGCMPSVLLTARNTGVLDACAASAAMSRSAGARPARAVDDEDHRVGLDDRLLGLARHLDEDAFGGARLEAAGVDGDEGARAEPAFAVVPVARHARHVVHDRVAAAREPVKERRLADVRPPDQGDDRLHGASAYRPPSSVCTRRPCRQRAAARRAPRRRRWRGARRTRPMSRARKCT